MSGKFTEDHVEQACLDWLDLLWISEDPEALTDCPHKFLEVRIEAEA